MPKAPCIIVYQFGGRDILRTETRVRVGVSMVSLGHYFLPSQTSSEGHGDAAA